MKRDADLQRAILKFIEEHCPPIGLLQKEVQIPPYDRGTTLAHLELLIEDGYVDGTIMPGNGGPLNIVVRKLTSKGHDAIAAVEDDTVWNKAKKAIADHGLSLAFATVVEIAKGEIRKTLKLP